MTEHHVNGLTIRQFVWNLVDSNSYLISENGNALLIDAVDTEELYQAVEKEKELTIILTHSHFDHICGLNRIRALKPNAKVVATRQCSENIGNRHKNMSSAANAFMTFYLGKPFDGCIQPVCCDPADMTFEGNEELNWNGHIIQLISLYGHSNDSLTAIVDGKLAFSGDSLLSIPTVTRFPGGNTKRFREEDIPRLMSIEADLIFPGHGTPGAKDEMISVNLYHKEGK